MPRRVSLLLLALLLGLHSAFAAAAERKPNILLILADDLGFADLGCYGGQIETPNLDALAAGGLRFTQFYNTARCWPTRGAILTGFYAQQIRSDNFPDGINAQRGSRPSWAHLIPEYLRELNYRNYHSGKWHIQGAPLASGFDHSYLIDDHNRFFNPEKHEEDGKPLPPVKPDSGYYLTSHIADHAIQCLREHAEKHADQPFFSYVAFTSPHFPLHALPEDIAKYRGRFSAGWEKLREQRLANLKKQGIVSCELSATTPGVPAWADLPDEQRELNERRMEIHAAMVDRMDRDIGRLLAQLRQMNAFDDTIVFFLSDNGASAESLVRGDGNDPTAPPGSAKTFLCLEPGGANVANTPLRYSKIFVHEGGISTPLVVHWPNGVKARGELRHNPGHVIDLPVTIVDLAGGKWPTSWNKKPLPAPAGRSLVPVLATDGTVKHDYLWWYHQKNSAIRVGDWKLVAEANKPWELFNLANDRSESHNLAESQPDKVRELETLWKKVGQEFAELAMREPPEEGISKPGKPGGAKPQGKPKAAKRNTTAQ